MLQPFSSSDIWLKCSISKMWCVVVFGILDVPSISCIVICLSLSSNVDTIAIEVLLIVVEGRPVRVSFSVNLHPSLNHLNHQATVLQFTTSWQRASHKLAVIISTALHLKHSILIYACCTFFII